MLSRDGARLKGSRSSAASGLQTFSALQVKAKEKVGEAVPSHLRLTLS